MEVKNIRNFSIIAHIDHGKSTLADRMLEVTGTIEKRKMKEQVLDQMELERERGITIKMQPVTMVYRPAKQTSDSGYFLNLIDTPGHIDFYYEVSRALKAVEGTVLLVDATQGVQAQTLTTLGMARDFGLTIIPAVSKVDSPLARIPEVKQQISKLLNIPPEEILEVSGKTGEGVEALLDAIVERIPCPTTHGETTSLRSLVFDFEYSPHRGVIVYTRIFDGVATPGTKMLFANAHESFTAQEVGIFRPEEVPTKELRAGQIGYIVTGIKEPGIASVGDTILFHGSSESPLPGYLSPLPVVWASVYPESQDDFVLLRQALERLRLSDSSLTFEEERSTILGRGFKCGFLGMLHLEIITERLLREFNLKLIIAHPSITYEVKLRNGEMKEISTAAQFPDYGEVEHIREPWVMATIISPLQYVSDIMQILYDFEGEIGEIDQFDEERQTLTVFMPLRELVRGFFDTLKRISSGYASLSYELVDMREADVTRMDVLIAEEPVPAFSRIISRSKLEQEAKRVVERLYELLPRQLFRTKIQARALGRIISSRTLSALRKDVTAHLYGGDITRKMKLREKQKKGKKAMEARGKVTIPQEVFLKMVQREE